MGTAIIAFLVIVIAMKCIEGKHFWEERGSVLAFSTIGALITLTVVSVCLESSFGMKERVTMNEQLVCMSFPDSTLKDTSIYIMADWGTSPKDIEKDELINSSDSAVTHIGTFYVLYDHPNWENDTAVGIMRLDDDSTYRRDYWGISNVGFAMSRDDTARIIKYTWTKDFDGIWTGMYFDEDSYVCIYLPKEWFETLPAHLQKNKDYSTAKVEEQYASL